jgi:hypothetical protein
VGEIIVPVIHVLHFICVSLDTIRWCWTGWRYVNLHHSQPTGRVEPPQTANEELPAINTVISVPRNEEARVTVIVVVHNG